MSYNADSLTTEALENQGEFHASKPRSQPMETHGHKPGTKIDSTETFSAETLSPGSAPPERTFAAQTEGGDGLNTNFDPTEGMPGAASRSLDTGLGKLGQGMSSKEMRHDGQPGRKKQEHGLAKHGATDEGQRGTGRDRTTE